MPYILCMPNLCMDVFQALNCLNSCLNEFKVQLHCMLTYSIWLTNNYVTKSNSQIIERARANIYSTSYIAVDDFLLRIKLFFSFWNTKKSLISCMLWRNKLLFTICQCNILLLTINQHNFFALKRQIWTIQLIWLRYEYFNVWSSLRHSILLKLRVKMLSISLRKNYLNV